MERLKLIQLYQNKRTVLSPFQMLGVPTASKQSAVEKVTRVERKSKTEKIEKPVAPRDEDIKWTNLCHGYVRVSTKQQADDGQSLEVQQAKIEVWCEANDLRLVKIYADKGVSGTSMDGRAQLQDLLNNIKQGETLMAYSISRLSRSSRDFLNIIYDMNMRGCRIILYNEKLDTKTPYGKFTATMFSAVAELEVSITKQRVSEALQHKIAKGEFVGRVPYGWKLSNGPGSDLIEVPEEQAVIQLIRDLREGRNEKNRNYTYEKIADRLNMKGYKPSGKSKGWTHTSVARIYKREGVVTKNHNRHIPAIQFVPIVPMANLQVMLHPK